LKEEDRRHRKVGLLARQPLQASSENRPLRVHNPHYHPDKVSRKRADLARPRDLDRLALRRTHQSKVAAGLPELSAEVHHLQLAPVRVSVVAQPSKGGHPPATASLASHLPVQDPAKPKAQKSAVNPE
jgi:hypothetical protein